LVICSHSLRKVGRNEPLILSGSSKSFVKLRPNLLARKLPFPGYRRELVRGIGRRSMASRAGRVTMMPMMMVMMVVMMAMVIVMAGGGRLLVGDHRRGCLHVLGRFSPRYNLWDGGGAAVEGGGGGGGSCGGRARAAGGGGGTDTAAAAVAAAGGGWSRGETFATTPRRGGG